MSSTSELINKSLPTKFYKLKKCRDDGRVKYSANVMKRLGAIFKSKKMTGSFIPGKPEGDHMVAFNDLVEMLVNDFPTLDNDMTFDIHFHSYDRQRFLIAWVALPTHFFIKI